MSDDRYPYQLPPLPYSYNALEPYIDEETMHYHHDKHFQNYVNGLNEALAPYPQLQQLTLTQLLSNPRRLPREAATAIMHNGGGVYNHTRYFDGLAPAGRGNHQPGERLLALINQSYGSFADFQKTFNQNAAAVFGSGWTILALTPRKTLDIVNLANQETMLPDRSIPLLYVDVWEHAYYLQYKNLRTEYLQNIWNVLVFPDI